MNILFATPECAPWVKTGGLGDVSGALPASLAALGHDVRVLMPAYPGVNVGGATGPGIDLPASGPFPAARLLPVTLDSGVTLLLLAAPSLYQRSGGPYVDSTGHDHYDNALRFGFLAHVAALLGTPGSPIRGWQADIVHANDWTCGLAPVFLAQARAGASPGRVAASVLTIHNIAFQGLFPMQAADLLGIPPHWRGFDGVEFWGQLSMLKAGLQFADAITTVSPTYAREIRTEAFGCGLEGVLRHREDRLRGILNGIDTDQWNPATDPLLPQRFDRDHLAGKADCKRALQARTGLEPRREALVFGLVSRMTAQKGIDLVLALLPRIVDAGAQLAVLGSGDPAMQDAMRDAAQRWPGQVAVKIGFDESLAHGIEAGADAFLMPSRFEPCGLNQMYSQAYGTLPLVGPVGGLLDSVTDATADPQAGTGFVLRSADAAGLDDALARAFAAWQAPATWQRLQRNAMTRHFGWEESAADYVGVYERALVSRDGTAK